MVSNNSTNVIKTSDAATVELSREISQLEQQLHAQLAAEKKLKEKNARSVELLKEFLIEQVNISPATTYENIACKIQ